MIESIDCTKMSFRSFNGYSGVRIYCSFNFLHHTGLSEEEITDLTFVFSSGRNPKRKGKELTELLLGLGNG